ncbi:MAG: hypothetical protein A2122_02780 [Candidatus Liptonbacteria bacterium GWB1_49_6]|uniref:Histidine phosphatase family protein n=1 Tax=Candidatus Liptonbacteria bacterium GWB1_49_6 TaxID=1798644 RepID=A0A1G2C6S7_9BACT|nr:MAG: hypothetical protein A2122_02780 [Candidatus Liptonbacteria bacterium GWB1_49_6]
MALTVYIVRHAQSTSNAMENNLGSDAELTPLGVEQARKIAARARRLSFEVILSSDFQRALQTAEIIKLCTRKKILITPLLREEKHPSELIGKGPNNPRVAQVKRLLRKNRDRKHWHFSDEENFFDLKRRMIKLMKFLERRKERNVLVVGHVMATRMLVGLMIFGENLTPTLFYKMRERMAIWNTGIIAAQFSDRQWKLLTWNDYGHLG